MEKKVDGKASSPLRSYQRGPSIGPPSPPLRHFPRCFHDRKGGPPRLEAPPASARCPYQQKWKTAGSHLSKHPT
jgi:hypothetical protein